MSPLDPKLACVAALHEERDLNRLLDRLVVSPGVAPHATCGYAQRTPSGWRFVAGAATGTGVRRVFDLASLSKPPLAICVARLVARGLVSWEQPLREVLPCTDGTFAGECNLEALLCHRAGLRAHVQLFRSSWAHESVNLTTLVRRAADSYRTPVSNEPVYSDLGYFLVGQALVCLLDKPLDHILHQEVFLPFELRMGSARAFWAADAHFVQHVASTEVQRHRGGAIIGRVHDDNAWVLAGTGCAGHAGVFADLEAVLRLGARFLDELGTDTNLEILVRRRPGGTLRMGFDGVSLPRSSAGRLAGPDTFGHLGFTGTSLFIDPERERVAVLLTNRVSPTRNNARLRPVRAQIHDFLWKC